MKFTAAALLAASIAVLPAAAQAPAWPSKPVRIMVGASAGGGTDIVARMLAERYQAAWGQPFVIENRPGAGNTIAADVAAHAPPDGHTILVATNSAQAIAPHMLKLNFDPLKDLVPVALIMVVPNIVAVAPTVKANNVKDLVAEVRAAPEGSYSCGSSGIGSTQHLACEAFALATKTKITHIPYKGSAPALVDLVGGQIQLDFDTTSSAMSFVKSNKIKALAVMTPQRSPQLPDVPTLAEAGVEGVEMSTWYGLFATAGTPRDIVAKLYAETVAILARPEIRKRLQDLGGEPGALTSEQFAAMNRADYERFGQLVKAAGIKREQ